MPDAPLQGGFACADLTTFCRLDELGLEVTEQRLVPDGAVLACRVLEPDQWCRRCGCEGSSRLGNPIAGARAARLATYHAGGRSKQAFETWLAERPQSWRDGVEVVAMDGFTRFKTATTEELPGAVAVMDPFHVVRVRHEALCERMGVRDLHRLVVAAAGLKLRAA